MQPGRSATIPPLSPSRAASSIPTRLGRTVLAVMVAAGLVLIAAPAGATGTRAVHQAAEHCATHVVPVRTAEAGPYAPAAWGELCYRGAPPPHSAQLLVQRPSHNPLYWASPKQ